MTSLRSQLFLASAAALLSACNNGSQAAASLQPAGGKTDTGGAVTQPDSADTPEKPAPISGAYLVGYTPKIKPADTQLCGGVQVRDKNGNRLDLSKSTGTSFSYVPPQNVSGNYQVTFYDLTHSATPYYFHGIFCVALPPAQASTGVTTSARAQAGAYFLGAAPLFLPKKTLLSQVPQNQGATLRRSSSPLRLTNAAPALPTFGSFINPVGPTPAATGPSTATGVSGGSDGLRALTITTTGQPTDPAQLGQPSAPVSIPYTSFVSYVGNTYQTGGAPIGGGGQTSGVATVVGAATSIGTATAIGVGQETDGYTPTIVYGDPTTTTDPSDPGNDDLNAFTTAQPLCADGSNGVADAYGNVTCPDDASTVLGLMGLRLKK